MTITRVPYGYGWGRRPGPRGRGGLGAFVPTRVSNAIIWLRADLGVTLDTTVEAWADQSGSGNDSSAPSAPQEPSFTASDANLNGQPSITFGGTDALQFTGLSQAAGDLTVFLSCKPADTAAAYDVFADNGNSFSCIYTAAAAGKLGFRDAGGTVQFTESSTTDAQVLVWRLTNGAPGEGWRNGTALTNSTNYAEVALSSTTVVGARTTTGSRSFVGAVHELVVYSRALADGERLAVENYMRARIGT